jgi:imidazolonepropionase
VSLPAAPRADVLLHGIAQLATATGPGPHRGTAQAELRLVEDAAIAIRSGRVAFAGPVAAWRGESARRVDLGGRAVVPGLVDPHTHLVWAGERLGDLEARCRGDDYEAILARGGGIRSTVRATAAADVETLVRLALPRVAALLRSGATTIEVKSGYGIDPEAELRMLEAIHALQARTPARLVATLLVHVPPEQDRDGYLARVVDELLPTVAARRLAQRVDVFVEREAFTVAEAERVLVAARALGLGLTLHADQFHAIGGVELAARLGAASVDHLEATGAAQIDALAASDTVATLLPGVSLELGLQSAPGRRLVDAGAAVAVATDLNPGSSPLHSTALALALSLRLNGLTPAEALVAGTANAAAALSRSDIGWLGEGARADMLVLPGSDWRELVAAMPMPVPPEIWVGGERVPPDGGRV